MKIKLVMRKFIIFDDGNINPFGTLEEEVHDLEKEYTHVIEYIHSPCYKNKAWVTRFFLVEVDPEEVTIQEREVTRCVEDYLERLGYTDGLKGTCGYHDEIQLVMQKECLTRYLHRGKGSCDNTIINDVENQKEEIKEFIKAPSHIGRWSETAFYLEKWRIYDNQDKNYLGHIEVTKELEDYLGVKSIVIDSGSIFKDTPVRC